MATEKESIPHHLWAQFVGHWKTEGKIPATDNEPEITITGTDRYEWLPGHHFLLHTVDAWVGDEKNETTEIIGFDKLLGKYTMHYFDNKGESGVMTVNYTQNVWTFLGETLKFTGGFKNDGKEFSGHWEQAAAKKWVPFMEIKLTRID